MQATKKNVESTITTTTSTSTTTSTTTTTNITNIMAGEDNLLDDKNINSGPFQLF